MMFKIDEDEKRVIEKTTRDGKHEKLFNGISIPPCLNSLRRRSHDNQFMTGSAIGRASLQSEYSFSDMSYSSSVDSFPFSISHEETKYQRPSSHHSNKMGLDSKAPEFHINEELVNDLELSENFCRMHISDKQKGRTQMRGFGKDPDESLLRDGSSGGATSWNFVNPGEYEGFNNNLSDYEAFQSSFPLNFDESKRSALLGLRQGCNMGESMRSPRTHFQANALNSSPFCSKNQMSYLLGQKREQGGGCNYKDVKLLNQYSDRISLNDDFGCSQLYEMDSNGGNSVMGSFGSPWSLRPEVALNVNNPLRNPSMVKERTKVNPAGGVTQALKHMKFAEGSNCEDGLIIEEGFSNPGMRNGCKSSWGQKYCHGPMRMPHEQEKSSTFGGVRENGGRMSSDSLSTVCSMGEAQGYICFIAKDQYGCRFLQRMLDEGNSRNVQIICNIIIGHVVELMVNPFGNYLVQKLLDICSEEQRMQIVLMVTKEPGLLVQISLNTHG